MVGRVVRRSLGGDDGVLLGAAAVSWVEASKQFWFVPAFAISSLGASELSIP